MATAANDPRDQSSADLSRQAPQGGAGTRRPASPWLSHLAELWGQPWAAEVIASRDVATAFRLLQRVGVSQRGIAALTGQTQSEISEILAGRQVRDIRVLNRMVDALELPREAFGLAPHRTDATKPDGPAGDPTDAAAVVALPERCRCGGLVEPDPATAGPGPSIDEIPASVAQADVAADVPSPLIEVLAADAARRLTVTLWTGAEVRMLRLTRRMSVRQFAAHLGVSDRMVSKWEARGRAITPSPPNQDALDTSLNMATLDQRARFTVLWRQAWPTTIHPVDPPAATGTRQPGGQPRPTGGAICSRSGRDVEGIATP